MPKLSRVVGTTSQVVDIFVQDSSSTKGAGLTGLTSASGGLTCYYHRNTANADVSVPLSSATLGTFTSGGFIVVDGTNMPGVYQIGIPNLALVAGADSVVLYLFGATNMAPVILEIELTAVNNQNGNTFGLAYLPQGPTMVKKNQSLTGFTFPMFTTLGNPATGVTVTGQVSLNGGALGALTNAVSEISAGLYTVNIAAADCNANWVCWLFTGTGCQNTVFSFATQP